MQNWMGMGLIREGQEAETTNIKVDDEVLESRRNFLKTLSLFPFTVKSLLADDLENQQYYDRLFQPIRDIFTARNTINLNWIKEESFEGNNLRKTYNHLEEISKKVIINDNNINLVLRGHFNYTIYFIRYYLDYLKNTYPNTIFNINILDGGCSGVQENFPEIREKVFQKGYNLLSYYGYTGTGFGNFTKFILGEISLEEAKKIKYYESTGEERSFDEIKKNFNPHNQVI